MLGSHTDLYEVRMAASYLRHGWSPSAGPAHTYQRREGQRNDATATVKEARLLVLRSGGPLPRRYWRERGRAGRSSLNSEGRNLCRGVR